MGRRPKQTFLQRRHTDSEEANEKIFNITNYQRNFKSRLQWDITSHQSEQLSSKTPQRVNAGKGVERRESSCTVGSTGGATMENRIQVPQKMKKRHTIWSCNPTPGHTSGEKHPKGYMHPNVHCSTVLKQPRHGSNLNVHSQRSG